MIVFQDIVAAVGVVFDAVTQAIMAMSFGFAMVPTAIAYAIGIVGCLAYGSVLPISMQAETIALAGTMGKDIRERLPMVMYAGFSMAILGGFGILQKITDFAGNSVVSGMMAGVGIILTKVSIDMVKESKLTGVVSMVVGILIYVFTQDLVYTIVGCVVVASAVSYFKNGKVEVPASASERKLRIHKPIVNFNVVRGTLALICLTVGANIAFGGITAEMAGATANVDGLSVYSGLADAFSSLFGGAPVEAIISPTAAAPNPMWSGIILMGLMVIILATGLLPKVAKFIPAQSIAGFLLVLGAVVTVPGNAFSAFNGADTTGVLSGGVAMAVTAVSDPFLGMLAGIIVKLITVPLGLAF